jgi:hypothetical protein
MEDIAMKIKDGAYAVYDFFEALKTDRNALPQELEENLSDKYDLTEQQIAYFKNIRKRAASAKSIIKCVEDKFGADETGRINKPNEAYSLAFGGEIEDIEEARSYNIAIGFHKKTWKARKYIGRTTAKVRFNSNNPYREIAENLAKGKEPNFEDLVFTAPMLYKCQLLIGHPLTSEERVALAMQGKTYIPKPAPEEFLEGIIKHELRHIFDNIMDNPIYFMKETAAELYSDKKLLGLDWDIKRVSETYSEQSKEKNKPEFEEIRKLLSQVPAKNLDVFSYVISYYYGNLGTHFRGINQTDFLRMAVPAWIEKSSQK